MPVVAYPLDPDLSNLPTAYSPLPNTDNDVPLTIFKVLKKKFPKAIKHVGILWANATAVHGRGREGLRAGGEVPGFQDRLRRRLHPQPDDLPGQRPDHEVPGRPDVLHPAAARLLRGHRRPRRCSSRTSTPSTSQGDAYSANLIKDGGAAVNGMYIEIGYAPLPGGRLQPAGRQALHQVDEDRRPQRQLRVAVPLRVGLRRALRRRACKDAGNPPTRAGLEAALDKVTSFNAGGLITDGGSGPERPGVVCRPGPGPERSDRPGAPDAEDRVHRCRTRCRRPPASSPRSGRCLRREGRGFPGARGSASRCRFEGGQGQGFLGLDVGDER